MRPGCMWGEGQVTPRQGPVKEAWRGVSGRGACHRAQSSPSSSVGTHTASLMSQGTHSASAFSSSREERPEEVPRQRMCDRKCHAPLPSSTSWPTCLYWQAHTHPYSEIILALGKVFLKRHWLIQPWPGVSSHSYVWGSVPASQDCTQN